MLRAAAPLEGCALLLGRRRNTDLELERIWPCCNSWQPPEQRRERFLLDPREQLQAQRWARERDLQVLGAAHSHPTSPAVPSSTDRELCFGPTLMLIRTGLAGTDSCEDNAGEENAGHLSAVTQGDTAGDAVPLRPWRAWWLLDDSDLPPQELPLLLAEGAGHLGE